MFTERHLSQTLAKALKETRQIFFQLDDFERDLAYDRAHWPAFARQLPTITKRLERSLQAPHPREEQRWWDVIVPKLIAEAKQRKSQRRVSYEWFHIFAMRAAIVLGAPTLFIQTLGFEPRLVEPTDYLLSNEDFRRHLGGPYLQHTSMGFHYDHLIDIFATLRKYPAKIVLPAVSKQRHYELGKKVYQEDLLPGLAELAQIERAGLTVSSLTEGPLALERGDALIDPLAIAAHDHRHADTNDDLQFSPQTLAEFRNFQTRLIKAIEALPHPQADEALFAYFVLYRESALLSDLFRGIDMPEDKAWQILDESMPWRILSLRDYGTVLTPKDWRRLQTIPIQAAYDLAHDLWTRSVVRLKELAKQVRAEDLRQSSQFRPKR